MHKSNCLVWKFTSVNLTDYIRCHVMCELAHVKKLPPRVRLFPLKSINFNFRGSGF